MRLLVIVMVLVMVGVVVVVVGVAVLVILLLVLVVLVVMMMLLRWWATALLEVVLGGDQALGELGLPGRRRSVVGDHAMCLRALHHQVLL